MKRKVIVIGAGVIGLAIARRLLLAGQQVVVIGKNKQVGRESSSRNSAVVHAGIYYQPGSLKAKLCRLGNKQLYAYFDKKNIEYKKIGKLIVATSQQEEATLEKLAAQAELNGVDDLQWLDAQALKKMEPQVKSTAGLLSPSTGIFNTGQLLQCFCDDIEKYKGEILVGTMFKAARTTGNGFDVIIDSPDGEQTLQGDVLINAAGLWAAKVAQSIESLPADTIAPTYYAKGNYFRFQGAPPFSKLIYPVPEKAGLGIHATIDLAGGVKFGPDVEWVDEIDYQVNLERKALFLDAISHYFPEITEADLVPEFAGIRPKILPPEQQPQDFLIQFADEHQVPGLVNLYGMDSPGLTAAMSIADYVAAKI